MLPAHIHTNIDPLGLQSVKTMQNMRAIYKAWWQKRPSHTWHWTVLLQKSWTRNTLYSVIKFSIVSHSTIIWALRSFMSVLTATTALSAVSCFITHPFILLAFLLFIVHSPFIDGLCDTFCCLLQYLYNNCSLNFILTIFFFLGGGVAGHLFYFDWFNIASSYKSAIF